MEVITFAEWDIPKDEERRKKYIEYMGDTAWISRITNSGIVKHRAWTDGNGGHVMCTAEFESMENYAKVWNDLEYHRRHARFYRIVDNFKMRVCRPAALDTKMMEEIDVMKQ